jgi:Lrp/AsnC family transcriptional regulator for asnA, asnC and gidA
MSSNAEPNDHEALDELDLAIVGRLQVDGRASFRSIAEGIGASETTVRNRMRRLFSEDLVQVVTVVRPMTTRTTMIAMFRLRVTCDPQLIADQIDSWPESTFVALIGGNSDLMVELVAEDRPAMYQRWRDLHELDGVIHVEMDTYLRVSKQLYAGPRHV